MREPRRRKMDTPEQVMWKLMKRVHKQECSWTPMLVCPECRSIPLQPVTAACGHTWCSDCAQSGCRCVCGAPSPINGSVDILVRDLIDTMFSRQRDAAEEQRKADLLESFDDTEAALKTCQMALRLDPRNVRVRLIRARIFWKTKDYALARADLNFLMKVDPRLFEAHYIMGQLYKEQKKNDTALKYLYVSWLLGNPLGVVRDKMVETMKKLIKKEQNRPKFMTKITRRVRHMMKKCTESKKESVLVPAVVRAADLECVVCSQCYVRPVVTPCGHTFCRLCIERCLDHGLGCPLCNASIERLRQSDEVHETIFVKTLTSVLPKELQCRLVEKSDMLPLMVCTAGFPSVSCPLLIKEGRYKLMVRRVLESGSRQFGMVSCKPCPSGPNQPLRYSEFGTMLEISDCVTTDDGCLILSTVGSTRFRIVACDEVDGYDVARIEPVSDKPVDGNRLEVQRLNAIVRNKAKMWVRRMSREVREEIEHSYGPMPAEEIERAEDGPSWIWWLLAALPITVQLKRMLLGTTELVLRLRAIDKTLDLRKWSLREHLHHEEVYEEVEEMEIEELEEEAPISPHVANWLVSAESMDAARNFAI